MNKLSDYIDSFYKIARDPVTIFYQFIQLATKNPNINEATSAAVKSAKMFINKAIAFQNPAKDELAKKKLVEFVQNISSANFELDEVRYECLKFASFIEKLMNRGTIVPVVFFDDADISATTKPAPKEELETIEELPTNYPDINEVWNRNYGRKLYPEY